MRRRPSRRAPPRSKVTDTGVTTAAPGLIQALAALPSSRLPAAVSGVYEPLDALTVSASGGRCAGSTGAALRSVTRAGGVPSSVEPDARFDIGDTLPASSITFTAK